MDYGPVGLRDTLAPATVACLRDRRGVERRPGVRALPDDRERPADRGDRCDAGPGRPPDRGLDRQARRSSGSRPRRMRRGSSARCARRAARATRSSSSSTGAELASCPTTVQRSLARKLTAAGADVVVGSHAHVLLGAGRLGRALVAYGLGNFVFYASREATSRDRRARGDGHGPADRRLSLGARPDLRRDPVPAHRERQGGRARELAVTAAAARVCGRSRRAAIARETGFRPATHPSRIRASMRRAAVILGVCLALLAADTGPAPGRCRSTSCRRVAIFYYTWYGTPAPRRRRGSTGGRATQRTARS